MSKTTKEIRDDLALEMGNRHARPVFRDMYPSKSRGEMAREFAQLFSLGFDAGLEHNKTESEKRVMTALSDTMDEQSRKITCLEIENTELKEEFKKLKLMNPDQTVEAFINRVFPCDTLRDPPRACDSYGVCDNCNDALLIRAGAELKGREMNNILEKNK